MEEDRAQADLGEVLDAEFGAERQEKQKLPKKRFIGRKEAAERAEKRSDTNGTIEDSGAIQGVQRASKNVCETLKLCSCTTKKDGQSAQPSPFRNP